MHTMVNIAADIAAALYDILLLPCMTSELNIQQMQVSAHKYELQPLRMRNGVGSCHAAASSSWGHGNT